MDLSAPIEYNGHTAAGIIPQAGGKSSVGVVFESVDFSSVSVDAFFDKRALQDGMDASDVYLGARTVTIAAGVYGSSKGDAFDRLQGLLAAYSPRLAFEADEDDLGFLPFKFYQPTADIVTWPTSSFPNGIPLQMFLRPAAPPRYTVNRMATGGIAERGFAFDVQLSLIARDPRKYHQTTTFRGVSTSSVSAVHRGDYPVFPIVTFSMTAAGSSSTILTIDGNSLTIDLSSVTSGDYVLNYATRKLMNTGGASFMGLLVGDPQYAEIQPGGSTLGINTTTGIANSQVIFRYNEAFS